MLMFTGGGKVGYSHSIVTVGFEEMSQETRDMPLTSLMMRLKTRFIIQTPPRNPGQTRRVVYSPLHALLSNVNLPGLLHNEEYTRVLL